MTEAILTSSAPDAINIIILGKIIGAYGTHGSVKVFPFADDPLSWGHLATWRVGHETTPYWHWALMELNECHLHKNVLIANFRGILDRNGSEAMKGMLVGVPRQDLPPTTNNEFYWADLIGLSVINTQDEHLGYVLGLMETSAHAVLRVGHKEEDGKEASKKNERLLPFVSRVVLDVSVSKRSIRVDWGSDW